MDNIRCHKFTKLASLQLLVFRRVTYNESIRRCDNDVPGSNIKWHWCTEKKWLASALMQYILYRLAAGSWNFGTPSDCDTKQTKILECSLSSGGGVKTRIGLSDLQHMPRIRYAVRVLLCLLWFGTGDYPFLRFASLKNEQPSLYGAFSMYRGHIYLKISRNPMARQWGRSMGCRSWMKCLAEVL